MGGPCGRQNTAVAPPSHHPRNAIASADAPADSTGATHSTSRTLGAHKRATDVAPPSPHLVQRRRTVRRNGSYGHALDVATRRSTQP